MAECKVKSFRAHWDNWDISWRWSKSGESTIRLPVQFVLELEDGSSKSDCIVGQEKRGQMQCCGTTADVFPNWKPDGPIGERYWWDGSKLSLAGYGEWDDAGRRATFKDKPGFKSATGALYMGAAHGPGYFDFRTFVNDMNTGKTLCEILWSMRIDVPNPGNGGFWWSFSNQK